MQLLAPKAHSDLLKKEDDQNKRKAVELASEINSLVKSFNATKSKIIGSEALMWKRHEEFRQELQTEIDDLTAKALKLRAEVEDGLKPLERRDAEVSKREEKADETEQVLRGREAGIIHAEARIRDEKADYEIKNSALDSREKDLTSREKDLSKRQNQFEVDRIGKEKILKDSQEKIRQYLETERAKLRQEQK